MTTTPPGNNMPDDISELTDGPQPPQNVRIVTPDLEIPVDLVYRGIDPGSGYSLWRVIIPGALADMLVPTTAARPFSLRADHVPGHTCIEIYFGSWGAPWK